MNGEVAIHASSNVAKGTFMPTPEELSSLTEKEFLEIVGVISDSPPAKDLRLIKSENAAPKEESPNRLIETHDRAHGSEPGVRKERIHLIA